MSSVKELLRGNVIDGTGTANYIPKFINTTSVGSSNIYDSNGSIVVGGNTPQSVASGRGNITINGSSESILNFSSANSRTGYLYHTGTDMILSNNQLGVIKFQTNEIEYMRIDANGLIGVQTNSPTSLLTFPNRINKSQINTGSLEIQSYALNNAWIGDNVYFDGAFRARNTGYSSQIYLGVASGESRIRFLTGTSSASAGASADLVTRMTVNSTGISFPNGYGIEFGETQGSGATSTLLDDYEEGTWTPQVIQGYSNVSYSGTSGSYIKVGSLVHYELRLQMTSSTATTSQVRISLPIAPSGGQGGSASVLYIDAAGVSSNGVPLILAAAGGGLIFYRPNGSGGAYTGNDFADTAWTIHVSGTYQA